MRTLLLLVLWIAFWICLSLRHLAPPVAPRAAVPRQPAWPSAKLWQQMLDERPSSFLQYPGGDDSSRPHTNWSPQRLRKQPFLLLHVEQCNAEGVSTMEQLATGRTRLTGSTRYYSHPLADVPLAPAEIAAYEELLPGLQPEPREALVRVLNRINPARINQLLAQVERPNSPDWWLDAEALSRLGSRRGLEKILASTNPDVRSLAPVLEWLRAPQETRLWKAALEFALRPGPGQEWARLRLLQFGPEPLRLRAYNQLNGANLYLSRTSAASLGEWGWRRIEEGGASLEAQPIMRGLLDQPWSPQRQRQARRLVLDGRWPADLRKSVAAKLLSENPANLAPRWLDLWPELWGEMPIGYGQGLAYRAALARLDAGRTFRGNILERLWLAGRLTPARVKKAMSRDPNLSREEIDLSSALVQEIPSGLVAEMLDQDGDDDWIEHIWPNSVKQDARIDRAALARLGRGKFGDYYTLELLFSPKARLDPKALAAIREQGGGPGGVASALLGKVELDGGDANFLACHLVAHLHLRHDNLPLERVCELQEGAPARLFQAAQAYLEASADPLAAQLVKQRGGRLLVIEGQALCRWLEWLPALRREALERQTSILAWSEGYDVRCEVRGTRLRVIRGAETRVRPLTDQELAFLGQLQKPAPFKPYPGYANHSHTLVCLAPQGGWALTLATLPPGHPARDWNQRLWEISQKPGGTIEWSFAADFPRVETLACYPEETFQGIALRQGQPVLKTWQGWCDLQLKPCPAPPAPPKSRWQAVREQSGIVEKTRLGTMDSKTGKFLRSYLFQGVQFENFCVEGRELYFETRGRVVHVTLPADSSQAIRGSSS